jgi:hypothetical protein
VDKELEGAAPADSGKGATAFAGSGQQPQGERKASNKQIKYLTDLAAERKLTLQDLNTDIHRRFGVEERLRPLGQAGECAARRDERRTAAQGRVIQRTGHRHGSIPCPVPVSVRLTTHTTHSKGESHGNTH